MVIIDKLWGNISFSKICMRFINTYEFQRMRNIKQLGSSYFVFSSACGNRFEHSIGVGFLANKFGTCLKKKYPDKVNDNIIECLTIAGLCHDIGHGPYSHIFDNIVNSVHEERSIFIIEYMVNKYKIDIPQDNVKIINNMILPKKDKELWYNNIICGKIDVDRIDYILRDSSNLGIDISFTKESFDNILSDVTIQENKLFYNNNISIKHFLESREKLYLEVYKNEKIIKIDNVVIEILKECLTDKCLSIEDFLKLDDTILYNLYHNPKYSKKIENLFNSF